MAQNFESFILQMHDVRPAPVLGQGHIPVQENSATAAGHRVM